MSASDSFTTPRRVFAPSTPRSVAFANAPTFYEQELDDILDLSSSSESDEAEDFIPRTPYSSGPVDSDRGHIKSTHLERNDYRALLETLRTIDQHDTAKHLMSAAMLNTANDGPVAKKLRKSWAAWPLAQQETKNSLNAESILRQELGAILHSQMIGSLRRQNLDIAADDLPSSMLDFLSDLMLAKLTDLLINMARMRLNHGGICRSTNKRLGTLNHHSVLKMAEHSGIVSEQAVHRAAKRLNSMFGTSTVTVDDMTTSPDSTPAGSIAEELTIGPGRFHLRGAKRLRSAAFEHNDDDLTTSATTSSASSSRPQKRLNREVDVQHGNTFSKDSQPR